MIRKSNYFSIKKILTASIVLSIISAFCNSCDTSNNDLQRKMESNPTNFIAYWGEEWRKKPFYTRIQPASQELIEKIDIENQLYGFEEKPFSNPPPDELAKAMLSLDKSMPENLKALLNDRFIGIFTVKKLGSTGYTETVYDTEEREQYAYIVLDTDLLKNMKANEWATWRENSFFNTRKSNKYTIKMVIESGKNNTIVNAFRYILLHETGHVLGAVSRVHSSWRDWQTGRGGSMDFPFQQLSWEMDENNNIISLFDSRFLERKNIKAYAFENSILSNEQILITYRNMKIYSNYPSLYGGQNVWEDFAESFTVYFHTEIDHKPWEISILDNEKPVLTIKSCWQDERCLEKREFMKKWFRNPFSEETSN